MKRVGVLVAVLAFLGCQVHGQTPTGPRPAKPKTYLGINLNGPADWNSELPFVDVFRLSRAWISQRQGSPWGQGPALDLDASGWVKKLDPNCFAETPMLTIEGGHYPPGDYTVLYEGTGQVEVNNIVSVVSRVPGKLVVKLDPAKGGVFLQIRQTDPANYVRNIRMIMPGFEQTYIKQPFHPNFLARWRGVSSLRFMDWMLTNNSETATWVQRPKPTDATTTTRGVPIETMVELSNQLGADPWFCMPHKADDDYVRQFATLVKSKLAPQLKIYIEYSNETWNGQFQQYRYAGQQGAALGFGSSEWENGWRYHAYRANQMFRIWEQVFGGKQRLVRVLSSQAANAYVSEQIVSWQDAYKGADALAIAPYFGMNVGPGTNPSQAQVEGWSVDQVLDHLQNVAQPEVANWIREQKAVADKYGLKLICYEAGQHAVGVLGGENSQTLTSLFHAANRHPRMGQLYNLYMDEWEKVTGGTPMAMFASNGLWSKWGSWGLAEHYNSTPAQYPKLKSVLDRIRIPKTE